MNRLMEEEYHWFAARPIGSDAVVCKSLELDGIRTYRSAFSGRILFLRCTFGYLRGLQNEFWGKLYFYRCALSPVPEPIPDSQMNNFILVTSVSNLLIPLGTVTPDFIQGDRVRVIGGVFRGAEGVIKRVKGDRRLIVSIDGVTAVATCFISPELLEKI